jgi:hypothetical protein
MEIRTCNIGRNCYSCSLNIQEGLLQLNEEVMLWDNFSLFDINFFNRPIAGSE